MRVIVQRVQSSRVEIDGEVSGKGSKLRIETACTLKAVRFLRTDGELIGIE